VAKSNADNQREWRRRRREAKKVELKQAEATSLTSVMRTPFFEWGPQDAEWVDFEMTLDQAGIMPPSFTDDSDPKSATGEIERGFDPDDGMYAGQVGSLARAEIMVGSLIDAAAFLAGIVNRYKQAEIKARIAEIEQSDLSDPETKRKALADIPRLQKMLDQLTKQVRWTFPQWKVTGD
jgi:hypothetical protein